MRFPQLLMGFWFIAFSMWGYILAMMYLRQIHETWGGKKLTDEEFFALTLSILILNLLITWTIA